VDSVIARIRSEARLFVELEASIEGHGPSEEELSIPLTEECVRYHAEFQPTSRATHIYNNTVAEEVEEPIDGGY